LTTAAFLEMIFVHHWMSAWWTTWHRYEEVCH